MKYGLDVNNKLLLEELVKVLESKGNFIVNFSTLKNKNTGALLYKKTLFANVTKIDVYLGIENIEDDEESRIYFNDFLKSEQIRQRIISILQKISREPIVEGSEQLYLGKNVNSLVIYCKIKVVEENIIKEKVIEKLIEVLDNIL